MGTLPGMGLHPAQRQEPPLETTLWGRAGLEGRCPGLCVTVLTPARDAPSAAAGASLLIVLIVLIVAVARAAGKVPA